MFNKFSVFVLFLNFVLFIAGCGASINTDGGIEPTEVLELDGEFEFTAAVEKEGVVALDMRTPAKSGYRIVGASFDPSILRLVHYLEYDDDGEPRAQYMFEAVADGATDILVKMQPFGGGEQELYKRVTISVTEAEGLFF